MQNWKRTMEIIEKHTLNAWQKACMAILASGEKFTDHKKRTCIEIRDLLIRLEKGCDASLPIQVLSRHSEWVYPALADIATVHICMKIKKKC